MTNTNSNLLKRIYDWVLHWAETPYGVVALFILAFAESSFFPVPPDVLLIALCMGAYKKWMWFAFSCSIASVVGGLAGYSIGFFLSNSLGEVLLQWIGMMTVHGGSELSSNYLNLSQRLTDMNSINPLATTLANSLKQIGESLNTISDYVLSASDKALLLRGQAFEWYNGPWGPWAVGIAGFTPIPYKIFTITAGIFQMNILPFIIASAISRSARFFLVAGIIGLTYQYYGPQIKDFIDKYFNWLVLAFTILLVGGFVILKYL